MRSATSLRVPSDGCAPNRVTARAAAAAANPRLSTTPRSSARRRSQRADIGIACRGRIDRLHREGGTVPRPAGIAVKRSFAPQCDQCAAHALRQQMPRRRLRIAAAGQRRRLCLVRHDDVDQWQQRGYQRTRRRRIEHDEPSRRMRRADRMRVRLLRYLVLQQQNPRRRLHRPARDPPMTCRTRRWRPRSPRSYWRPAHRW